MSSRERVLEAYERTGGNVSATARETGLSRGTVQHHLRRAGVDRNKPIAQGKEEPTKVFERKRPRHGVKRFILTSAQNNTRVHEPTWQALNALAEHWGAELLCASYTYNQNAYGKLAVKPGTHQEQSALWFDARVKPLLEKSDHNIELAPGLVWCGRMNTLPTAVRPLSGFETYTGRQSGIFPHAKISMESVASGKHEPTKFNYTTGTVTQINYVQKKAGLRAEHHHSYGGLVVEVDNKGRWWVRQLHADKEGTIYDLDLMVKGGKVQPADGCEAITWGDIHCARLDPTIQKLGWGWGGMLDTLRPGYQFLHDVLDFRARNHHERSDAHKRFLRHVRGEESVEAELALTAEFMNYAERDYCQTVVVDSNHDGALVRWLKDTDWRDDPVNALFYLEAQLEVLRALKEDTDFHVCEWALQRAGCPPSAIFLREDQPYVLLGIEMGMHGHLGPNGMRGTPQALSRMGRKANTAHTHSAGIYNGMYVAGTSSALDMEYNKGPSSWSHSHVVTHLNGKRQIVTMWDGKWRA